MRAMIVPAEIGGRKKTTTETAADFFPTFFLSELTGLYEAELTRH